VSFPPVAAYCGYRKLENAVSKGLRVRPRQREWRSINLKSTPAAGPMLRRGSRKSLWSPSVQRWAAKNVASGDAPFVSVVQSPDLGYRHHSAQLGRLNRPWVW